MTCVFLEGKRELKDAHKNQRKEGGKRVSITDNTLSTNLIGRHYKTYRFELICPAERALELSEMNNMQKKRHKMTKLRGK